MDTPYLEMMDHGFLTRQEWVEDEDSDEDW
jgi:hypothetical protein